MQQEGYRIIPVHPTANQVLGEKVYPTLDEAYAAEGKIDLVDVFRASEYVPEIVKDVIRLKIPYLWLQEGRLPRGSGQLGRSGWGPGSGGPLYLQGTRTSGPGEPQIAPSPKSSKVRPISRRTRPNRCSPEGTCALLYGRAHTRSCPVLHGRKSGYTPVGMTIHLGDYT